jgi:hypothetical protein
MVASLQHTTSRGLSCFFHKELPNKRTNPTGMNRLQYETSPYLQQHAHNPVDWYAWKPEAFERARRENKPILVSIGYSTCHWCHVMERESFEDVVVADFMNRHFVNIKVDREERPDVDAIHMEACQVIAGSGGWPLNCFLTPDGRPFYAGAYYPPQPAFNRPSWTQVLQSMVHHFTDRRQVVEDQANRLVEIIKSSEAVFLGDALTPEQAPLRFTPVLLQNIYYELRKRFDRENGGFGGSPKFPGSMSLEFLLQYHHFLQEPEALAHVERSLEHMIQGGIYDQLGGGFARYSTDAEWLVPHFEKMLYDNALLVGLLSDVYRVTKKTLYSETIEETLKFIQREMTGAEGGFYSALDADSEGVEGKFYVWEKAEVEAVLRENADLFCKFYDVTSEGNWEGTNILWRPQSYGTYAIQNGIKPDIFEKQLKSLRNKLFAVRAERIRPHLDDKMLLDWNALMCTAYAKAYAALGNPDYKNAAERNLHFLLEKFQQADGKTFYHTYKEGKAQYDAFLDDYANLIEAILNVYTLNFEVQLLERAAALTDWVIQQFHDSESGLFFFTSENQSDILLRRKELYDNATPSGNSTMIHNLFKLAVLLHRPHYKTLAMKMLHTMRDAVERYPASFARWATALVQVVYPMPEIAVVGENAFELAQQLNRRYLPYKVLMAAPAAHEHYPLLAGRNASGETNIYICRDYACQLPVKTLAEAEKMLDIGE